MEGLQQTGIYVINGNHDINNSYSSDYSKAEYWNAQRVQPEDFKALFGGLGYGDTDSYDHNPSRRRTYNPGGELAGGLSYVTEIAEGITLIVLDTGIYSDQTSEHYGHAQQTPGQISDGLLAWAVNEAQAAKSNGNLVLAMCHHGVIPHYSGVKPEDVDWYMSSFIIADWESRTKALADAGVTAVLTGHTHASDIAKYISPDGNVLYDIETAALCAYPTAWRTLTITINGTGKEKTYSFSVETRFIDKDFAGKEEKTADWEIMYGENKGKTFAQYDGSMQEYGKEKSRYHQDTLRPMIDYMLRVYLYDFIKTNGSLENYHVELLGGSEGNSLKDVIAPLIPLIPAFVSLDQTIKYDPYQITLSTTEPKSADEGNKLIIYVTVTTESEEPGQGQLVIDLDFLPQYAQDLVSKIDAELLKDDWMTNNYGNENRLLENIVDALSAAVEPLLIETKLDESDPDTTVLNIYNDAMMAWAHGDEGKASAEDQTRREKWNGLLTSDKFIDSAKQNILAGLFNLENFSVISDILSTKFTEDPEKQVITFTSDGKEVYSPIYTIFNLLEEVDSASAVLSLIQIAYMFSPDTVLSFITTDLLQPEAEMLAALQKGFTNDMNIPEDSEWDFHTVLFYADDSGEPSYASTTIEENKIPEQFIAKLPEKSWFTAPKGGEPVDPAGSLKTIYRIYAHAPKPKPTPEPGPYDPGIPELFPPSPGPAPGHRLFR